MFSYTRRGVGRLLALGWATWCSRAFAQQKPPSTEVKIGVPMDSMSEVLRGSLERRLKSILVDGRYVRSISRVSAINQSGPSTDPDYSEFWLQVVPKGQRVSSPIFSDSDWSEEAFLDVKPQWDEMVPRSVAEPTAAITMKAKMGRMKLSPTLYRDLLEELYSKRG